MRLTEPRRARPITPPAPRAGESVGATRGHNPTWFGLATRAPLQRGGAALPSAQTDERAGALPEPTRGELETAFGLDLSPVRVHEDSLAQSHGALALTRGTDIHFAPGRYRPHERQGRTLLAHELVHVVQQAQSRVTLANADASALEREADDLGARAARGQRLSLGPVPHLTSTAPVATQLKVEIQTGDLASAGFRDWSYVAYLGQGLIRLRFCKGKDCEDKGQAIGTIGWVTNNPTHLDVSDDPGKPAARAPRASGGAYQSSETRFGSTIDGSKRFSRFAIFSDSSKGLAAVIATWKAYYEGDKAKNPDATLADIIKKHKGLEKNERKKLDAITDPAKRKAADPREHHLSLTRGFMIDALTKSPTPMSQPDATAAVDQLLITPFRQLLGGPDPSLNAAHMFNLLTTLQAVARTEGMDKPSGVIYRCDGGFEHDPLTRYSAENQRRITALTGSADVSAELRGILGCK